MQSIKKENSLRNIPQRNRAFRRNFCRDRQACIVPAWHGVNALASLVGALSPERGALSLVPGWHGA